MPSTPPLPINSRPGAQRLREWIRPLPWLLLIGTAFYWRFGYNFGTGDHDEFIPAVLALLNPELFRGDWFVEYLTGSFNVRTPFLVTLASLGAVLSVPLASMVLYVACSLSVLGGLYALARTMGAAPVAALGGVAAVVLITPTWTLGGNSIYYGLLAPELMGWALVVPAIVLVLHRRLLAAALLLGLASWFHVLAGFLPALSLGIALLMPDRGEPTLESLRRATLRFGLPYVAVVAPLVAHIGLSPIEADTAKALGVSSFYIIAELRLPHHYLPLSFGLTRYFQVGVLLAAGLPALLRLRRGGSEAASRLLLRWLAVIGVMCVLGFIFTEINPSLLVARLQLFKMTVFLQVVLTLSVAIVAYRMLPTAIRRIRGTAVDSPLMGWGTATALLILTIVLLRLGVGRPAAVNHAGAHAESDLYQIERWARSETHPDAVFLVPPSNTTFRTHARRAVVVTYKAVPFDDAELHHWFQRLVTVADTDLPRRGTGDILLRLDEAYHNRPMADWSDLARRSGAAYALVDVQRLTDEPGLPVAREGRWAVYRVIDEGRES